MANLSKRMKAAKEAIEQNKLYALSDALDVLRNVSSVKFNESVDICVNLGVDPRKSDQVVRGSTLLPKGIGKEVRVAVFTQGDNAGIASDAGADIVGFEDLAEQVKKGVMDFDVVIATPDAMRIVGQLGQILGPRGLMPNPKLGTVTTDVKAAVLNAKAGQARYRTDKNGIIHTVVGKVKFSNGDLSENIFALLTDLRKAKPAAAKGAYFKKISISTTMGPGIAIDQSSIDV